MMENDVYIQRLSSGVWSSVKAVLVLLLGVVVIVVAFDWYSDGGQQRDHEPFSVQDRRPPRWFTSLVGQTSVVNDTDEFGCQRTCGNVWIPYPFGLSPECAINRFFQLECTYTSGVSTQSDDKPMGFWPFLANVANGSFLDNDQTNNNFKHSFQVLQINDTDGTLVIETTDIKATSCSGYSNTSTYGNASIELPANGPYRISGSNIVTAVGCSSAGQYSSYGPIENYGTDDPDNGALCGPNSCENQYNVAYPFCNVYDCCTLPMGTTLNIYLRGGGISFQLFSTCGYATILYPPSYSTLHSGFFGNGTYGTQLLWAIQEDAITYPDCSSIEQSTDYACSSYPAKCTYINQTVVDDSIPNLVGYTCKCTEPGYEGNGYKRGTGCNDINECARSNKCASNAICTNLPGSFNCSCPSGMKGDGFQNSTGCVESGKSNTALIAGLSVSSAVVLIIANCLVCGWLYRKRKRANLAQLFGSAELTRMEILREIQSKDGANICKLFTLEELDRATRNFSIDKMVGTGGFGTVFQGTLDDGRKVAVKKAKRDVGAARDDTKQFINEVTILSQVNHRNLVKLLGCCLETSVPVLVYEFIFNGSLESHLRRPKEALSKNPEGRRPTSLEWSQRLKIAIDTAEAISYLHSGTSPPIYHRDVKTANILLDRKYVAKVADFGLSKFVSLEATHLSTGIQGTPGYLDPDYFDTYQITDKSDVYSFGVVLLEILTAEKPIDISRPAADQNLALRCRRLLKFGLFEDIIDPCLEASSDPTMLGEIHATAQVAMRCAERQRQDRPNMGEVLLELKSILKSRKKPQSDPGQDFELREAETPSSQASSDNYFGSDSLPLTGGVSTNSEEFFPTSRSDVRSSSSGGPSVPSRFSRSMELQTHNQK